MILDSRGHEANGNGADLSARQLAKYKAQNATIGEVNEIATEHAIRACNHLGNQIPGLIHHIISQAMKGYDDAKRMQFESAVATLGEPLLPSVQKLIEALRPVFGLMPPVEAVPEPERAIVPEFAPIPPDAPSGFLGGIEI